jgi:hypothetical protein
MNAIDAHKDELESLLVNLVRDAGVSRTDFGALLDAYIKRLDKKLHRRQSTRRFGAATNRRRTNMEPTLTQNCALYYAQHTIPRHRPALFRRFRAAARSQTPSTQRQMLSRRLPLYRDYGR